MKSLRPELKKLINTHFNEDQKRQVEELLETESDSYVINYSILAIAIEDDLVYGDANVIKKFYNIEDLSVLTHVDIIIAKILITLSNKLERDMKYEYETALTLDKTQPELRYLTTVICQYLCD